MGSKYKRIDLSRVKNLKEPDVAYVLGFVAADGHIWKNPNSNGKGLKITLNRKDRALLEKIKTVLNVDQPIYDYEYDSNKHSILTIYQLGIVDVFSTWGIHPRKSKTIRFPEDLPRKFLGDYLRGVFDGDGHVGVYTRGDVIKYKINITSGSELFLKDIQKELKMQNISSSIRSSSRGSSVWYDLDIKRENLEMFYGLMYTNSNGLHLDRKKDKFKVIFSYRKDHKGRFKALEKGKELREVLTETYLRSNYNVKNKYKSVQIIAKNNNTTVKTIYKHLKRHGITSNE